MDSNGEIVSMKALSVDDILTDKIGREQVKFNPRDFPRLSKETLQEAGKPLPRKHLDILVGNPDLALQPVCEAGFRCQDCAQGRCLYRSKFGSGYVPLDLLARTDPLSIPSSTSLKQDFSTYPRSLLPGRSSRCISSGQVHSLQTQAGRM